MLKNEFKNMEIYNPFTDSKESLECTFVCHIDSRGNLDHVETSSIISEAGVELTDYLSEKQLEAAAEDFKNEYGEWV